MEQRIRKLNELDRAPGTGVVLCVMPRGLTAWTNCPSRRARPGVYPRTVEGAATCDDLWNAIQDPNTYANILSGLGLHDRPWGERPVFGTVRGMSRAGMDRKTGVKAYIKEIDYLERTGKELNT